MVIKGNSRGVQGKMRVNNLRFAPVSICHRVNFDGPGMARAGQRVRIEIGDEPFPDGSHLGPECARLQMIERIAASLREMRVRCFVVFGFAQHDGFTHGANLTEAANEEIVGVSGVVHLAQ
ncbi:MAG: hypothetical protein CL797_02675 [Chromatiales bacterium]|nr:hypothetical protein [Chromatiales bacterium]